MPFQPSLPGLAPPCRPEPARTARAALARYPDVLPDDLCTHAKGLGLAGEHLVDCVLAMLGERVIPTPEHEQFDRIVWLDQRLLRVQIKTRHVLGAGGYVFNVRRGYQSGPFGTRPYDPQDFDVLALVALPEFVVTFTAEIPRLRRQPRASFDTALHDLDLAAIFAAPDIDAAQAELARLTTPDTKPGQVTLADVHGQPTARQALEDLCNDLAEWRAGRLAWSEVTRSFLLYGPPGNGKTMLSEALAGSAGVPLIATSYSDNQRLGHQGDMLKGLTDAVTRACTQAPSVFFIDEIDAFHARGQSHNGYIIGVVTGLLTQLDRLMKTEGVIVLAATNHPDTVDPAIRRAGRFDRHIPVTPPDRDGVLAILAGAISDIPAPDAARLADRLLGQSGAEITALVRAARTRARRRGAALAPCDLDAAAADLAPAPDPDTLRRVAVHEAGHLLAGHLFGAPAAQRAILRAGGGAVERPKPDFLTRARIEALVRTCLGGRAAEALVFEEVSSGAGGGDESDLAMATQLLTDAEMRLGLGDTLTWQSPDSTARLLAQQSRTRIEDALRTAEAETREALTRHRAALDRIAEAIIDKRELHAEDLANLLDQVIPDTSTESAGRVDADELTTQTSGA